MAEQFFRKFNKSQVLVELQKSISNAFVLEQYQIRYSDWTSNSAQVMSELRQMAFFGQALIIRSSSSQEDGNEQSLAGAFESVLNVVNEKQICEAIDHVFRSFTRIKSEDMVFVQPMLKDVVSSGVAFTRDPNNGGAYFVIDLVKGEDTTSVTSGNTNEGKTIYIHHEAVKLADTTTQAIIRLCKELQELTDCKWLDIEFAIDTDEKLFLLQARPLLLKKQFQEKDTGKNEIEEAVSFIHRLNQPRPHFSGGRMVLGNMTDWNPAEMIGIRPRPLALSLYRELITDRIWAYQRDNYGYKNLRSVPLMYSILGFPYIDVRASFFSFIPKLVSPDLSRRLVDYYIVRLLEAPELHDKIEFDIVFSCYTPATKEKLQILKSNGFTDADISELIVALRDLTNRITHSETGLWLVDRGKIDFTYIGNNSMIDNMVHIAHNVVIGRNACIAAQTGISGSVIIGDNVTIGGQVGFAGHINIGDNVVIAAKSGVTKNIKHNSVVAGFPAIDIKEWKKNIINQKKNGY